MQYLLLIYEDESLQVIIRNHMVKMLSLTPDEMTTSPLLARVSFDEARLEAAQDNLEQRVDVFGFQDADGAPLYLIYNEKRGTWYPFAPRTGAPGATPAQERDAERELRLKALLGAGLPVEPDVSRWFPLWGIPI